MDEQPGRSLPRVWIVDDHAGFRRAVEALLSVDGRMQVTASMTSAEDALDALARIRDADREAVPDLIVMDVNMSGMNGMDAAARILCHHPGIRVVVCSTMPATLLPPLPSHADAVFVPKDEIDPDALWAWLRVS